MKVRTGSCASWVQRLCWLTWMLVCVVDGAAGKGPCDAPPYDPMLPVSSAEQARNMDGWALKALRRDARGGTCEEIREVVDILIVRWLQAHPDLIVAFEGEEAVSWLEDPEVFLARIKTEALVIAKGRRALLPRGWGRSAPGAGALRRRGRCSARHYRRFTGR